MKKILTIIILLPCLYANATTYYISLSGSAMNDGTSTSTTWPFSKIDGYTFSAGDQILFNGGETFYGTLRIKQSGTTGNPITIGSYGTGRATITGLKSITSWTNLGSNIWQSTDSVSPLSYSNIVVINGNNTPMGRYPNSGYLTYQSHSGTISITTSSLTGTPDWTGAELVLKKKRWILDRNMITAQSGGTLSFTGGTYMAFNNSTTYEPTDGFGFFIQNDSRTLDQQNEWYYNPTTKKLSVYSSAEPTDVKIATLDTLITLEIYSHDYVFENLILSGCNENAINIGSVSNLTFKNCTFQFIYTGISQSNWGAPSSNWLIDSCEFYDLSNLGIRKTSEATNSLIQNTTFKRIGMIPGAGGSGDGTYSATSLYGDTTQFKHNVLDFIGYNGIDFNMDYVNISYNFVQNFCLLKDDGGGIYTGNPHVNDTIEHNVIINGGVPNAPGTDGRNHSFGIYLDDYASNFYLHNNSIYNTGYAGIYIHNAQDCRIENNTIYNPLGYFGFFASTNESGITTTGIIFKNNIVTVGTGMKTVGLASWQEDMLSFGTIDSNYHAIYDNGNTMLQATWYGNYDHYYSLSGWQSYSGYDTHSTVKINVDSSNTRFEYNETQVADTISLDAVYTGVDNIEYNGSIILQPYSSAILIKSGELLPPVSPNAYIKFRVPIKLINQ